MPAHPQKARQNRRAPPASAASRSSGRRCRAASRAGPPGQRAEGEQPQEQTERGQLGKARADRPRARLRQPAGAAQHRRSQPALAEGEHERVVDVVRIRRDDAIADGVAVGQQLPAHRDRHDPGVAGVGPRRAGGHRPAAAVDDRDVGGAQDLHGLGEREPDLRGRRRGVRRGRRDRLQQRAVGGCSRRRRRQHHDHERQRRERTWHRPGGDRAHRCAGPGRRPAAQGTRDEVHEHRRCPHGEGERPRGQVRRGRVGIDVVAGVTPEAGPERRSRRGGVDVAEVVRHPRDRALATARPLPQRDEQHARGGRQRHDERARLQDAARGGERGAHVPPRDCQGDAGEAQPGRRDPRRGRPVPGAGIQPGDSDRPGQHPAAGHQRPGRAHEAPGGAAARRASGGEDGRQGHAADGHEPREHRDVAGLGQVVRQLDHLDERQAGQGGDRRRPQPGLALGEHLGHRVVSGR